LGIGFGLSAAAITYTWVLAWVEQGGLRRAQAWFTPKLPHWKPTIKRWSHTSFDEAKWNALLKYDEDIASAAEKVRPLDEKWIDELARAYLVLNDKQYLPNIVQKIISDAQSEQSQRQGKP